MGKAHTSLLYPETLYPDIAAGFDDELNPLG
jgi:hypothetical protein